MRVLVVDNHDSFVYNLVQYLQELGADCTVKDRSETTLQDAATTEAVLLSPGPGHPADSGICLDLVHDAADRGTPLLGVCLGHQIIAHAYGAKVSRAPEPVHGYTSEIIHNNTGVFRGIPTPFQATRYHSLTVDPKTVPKTLTVTAQTPDGTIMALRHRTHPIEGIQFHPESILSTHGHHLLNTWLTPTP
ncbi:aminodeoxychorismate/anthranilate synthase component II [Actinomadura meridiana]|uniref:Aminodeoxychorismate/anthranilate synthase component II n=1 Tax=Actinomadura meridiana TaxID=559626 RepID=A0ABP8CH29_9ACTN